MSCLLFSQRHVHSAEKKEEKKKPEPPSIALVLPLAISPGLTNKVKLRGQNLTNVTEIRFANSNLHAQATIKSKSKAEVPKEMDAKKVGDSQVDIEVIFPAETPRGTNSFTLVSPDGESMPGTFVLIPSAKLVAEKEPNGSFREAQKIDFGKTVQGAISEAKEVDVFRLACKAKQRLRAEVEASGYGSSLDSILTLYDEQGHQIAANDDFGQGSDSRLEVTIPKDGVYLLSLQDAQDKGGATYVYLLSVRLEK
jgi:hypothetical protein